MSASSPTRTPPIREVTPIAREGERVVAIVAHPDDESFGCGSLIALAVAAGAEVSVICATRGEEGERVGNPVTDHLPLALVRERELRDAARELGADGVELLGFRDSGFSGDTPNGALVDVELPALAALLRDRLVELDADLVITLDGSDGHRDHRHLREAVAMAIDSLGRPVRLVESCLARSLMVEWADEVRRTEPGREYLALAELGRADEELTSIDSTDVLDTRLRALACHRSQTSPFDAIPAGLRLRMLTTEFVVERTSLSRLG